MRVKRQDISMREVNNKRDIKELVRVIKFTLISISAGIIQIGTYTLFFTIFHFDEWLANALSMLLSVVWNFTVNRKITFKSANNIKIAMLLVALFYAVFLPISSLLTDIATDNNVNSFLVEALVMISNFVLEFLYIRFIVYRNSCDTAIKKENS